MLINQAIYGLRSQGGHGLLETSGELNLAQSLSSHLDLPDTASFEWSSYISGFRHNSHYVLARISPDTNAARGGMVFAHALLIPIDVMVQVDCLDALLGLLAYSSKEAAQSGIIDIQADFYCKKEAIHTETADLYQVTNNLAQSSKLPLVLCDPNSFEKTIIALWHHLWPSLRQEFSFRLSFSPKDLDDSQLTIAYSPLEYQSRWNGYTVINPRPTASKPESLASKLLCGLPSSEPLSQFKEKIGSDISKFGQLRLLEVAFKKHKENDFESKLTALRLISAISPSPDKGSSFKASYLETFSGYINKNLSPSNFFQLQNLDLSAFPSSDNYPSTLKNWVISNEFSPVDDELLVKRIKNIVDNHDKLPVEWKENLIAGLVFSAQQEKVRLLKAIWRWIGIDSSATSKLINLVESQVESLEMKLARSAPAVLEGKIGDVMKKFAAEKKWHVLHGASLAAYLPPLDAIDQQIAIDLNQAESTGILYASKFASDEEIVSAACSHADKRLIFLAAEKAAKTPNLLATLDFEKSNTIKIWNEAIKISHGAWEVSKSMDTIMSIVLDSWLNKAKGTNELIGHLSQYPIANLCHYDKRELIWDTLTNQTQKESYLRFTATGWLNESINNEIPFSPDVTLGKAIGRLDLLKEFSQLPAHSYHRTIEIVGELPNINEDIAIFWARNFISKVRPITTDNSTSFGVLINKNNWEKVLSTFIDSYSSGRQDLKHLLQECTNMIGWWQRITLGISSSTHIDWWKVFETEAVELYRYGPTEGSLWERAGGKDSDLRLDGSGKEQWAQAMQKCKYGINPKPQALLDTMLADFGNNSKLTWLKENRSRL